MCSNLRLGEVRGSYLLLIRKLNGEISSKGEDEKFLRGIICFFEYIIYSAISQEPINNTNLEKCFSAFSTKNYLGPGFDELSVVIKEREQELFFLKKTEDFLRITKNNEHDIEINLNVMEKIFCNIREFFQKSFLVDPKKGIMMVFDEVETIHTMSMDVVNNGTKIFHISF
jgi:hypothetical protein